MLTLQHILLLQDPPSFLRQLLNVSTPRYKAFRKNIVKYNNALCMASEHANWVSRGEGKSGFKLTVTLQGRNQHWCFAAASGRTPAFMSVYIHYTDFDLQSELRSRNFAGVDPALLTNPANMLNRQKVDVQSFMSLHELARENAPTNRYKIVFHADKRHANEHLLLYNGPSYSELTLIPGNERRVIGKRDILLRRRGQANLNENEVLA